MSRLRQVTADLSEKDERTVPISVVNRIFLVALSVTFASLTWPAASAPDEDKLCKSAGYPIGTPSTWFFDECVRVGSFSQLDRLLPHNVLKKAAIPTPLVVADNVPRIEYQFESRKLTIDDFLARQRITGILIAKDSRVLVERYQYDRNAAHRFVSHSMAKSIVSLAIGIALEEKKIASLDDRVARYVPRLAGSAYGETSIRNILRMSSGVRFSEVYDGKDDLAKFTVLRRTQGSIEALRAFNDREIEQGARFHYATSETVVLSALIRAVTGSTLSEYLTGRLWQPMGAEADATWIRTADGLEVGGGSFNATLRDYGRLGICAMMARSVPSRCCLRIIYSKPQTGIVTLRHSHQGERRRTSVMATNSGPIPARSEGLRCLAFMASRSSLIRNSNLPW